jgi:beta-phosphoglucomutase
LKEKPILYGLFDLDGVLIDSAPFHYRSWKETLLPYGIEFTYEMFLKTFGSRNEEILSQYLPHLKKEERKKVAEEKEALYRKIIQKEISFLEGAEEFLRSWKEEGWVAGLYTSTPEENLTFLLRLLPLQRYFSAFVTGNDVKKGKPDPEGYLLLLSRLKGVKERAIVFEDAPSGILAGKRAGLFVCALTTTHPSSKLPEADLYIRSFSELTPSHLLELLPSLGKNQMIP